LLPSSNSPSAVEHACGLALSIILFAGASCAGAEDAPPAPVSHLLSRKPDAVDVPRRWLPEAVAPFLAEDQVWILEESVASRQWKPAYKGTLQHGLWNAETSLPIAGAPRLVLAEQAAIPTAGERLPADSPEPPEDGMVVIGPGGAQLATEVRAKAPDVVLSYPTEASALRAALLLPADESEAELEPHRLGYEEVTRRVVMPGAPSRLAWSTEVLPEGRLSFSFGLLDRSLHAREGGVKIDGAREGCAFQVECDGEVLWERRLAPDEAGKFHDATVDLARFAGGRVELALRASLASPGAADGDVFPFWAEPLVLGKVVPGKGADPPPSILIVLIDTLRADRLGCYGWKRAETPNMDRLAREGVRFADAIAAASWTLPSHASLFTSLYSSEHGVNARGDRLSGSATTLAEVLREHGYQTAAFVEGGFVHARSGFDQGFDTFDSSKQGALGRKRDVNATFAPAMDWIARAGRPFFVFLHTYQLHSPYDPPEEVRARLVRPYDGPLPRRVHPPDYSWGKGAAVTIPKDDLRYVRDLYDAELAYTDRAVGELLRFLDERGLARDTLVVLTSDHGEELGDHGHFGHGFSLYQEQLRVPLLMRLSGRFDGGRVVEHAVHGIDLAPTLARLAGAAIPAAWSGEPITLEAPASPRLFFVPFATRQDGEPTMAMRSGSLKYIDYPAGDRPMDELGEGPLLFDLSRDPAETRNLWKEDDSGRWIEPARSFLEQHGARFERERAAASSELDEQLDALGYGGEE
jgi:arylsulfatase A-like enzyme